MSNAVVPTLAKREQSNRRLSLTKSHIKRAFSPGPPKRPQSPKAGPLPSFPGPPSTQHIPSSVFESPSSSRASSNGATTPVTDDQSAAGVESITVMVRTRPLNDQEMTACGSATDCLKVDPSSQAVTLKPLATSANRPGAGPYSFRFDYALPGSCPQSEVFGIVGKEACDHFLDGFNVAIFAYGQTGAGKTYTMYGELKVLSSSLLVALAFFQMTQSR